MPIHLRDASHGDISENVIAVGDPARVDLLSSLLSDVKTVNLHRGFKTVTGFYKGRKVSIATHGIGAPSAAIVFEELHQLGAKRIVRVGTAGGVRRDTRIGDVVVATGASYTVNGCGLGQYMPGLCGPAAPDPLLTARIIQELEERKLSVKKGPVFSSDAFYAEDPSIAERLSRYGIVAIEMEAAILFTLGWMRGLETSCVLVISDVLHGEEAMKEFLSTKELAEIFLKVGEVVLEVFNRYY
ncbi:MAG: purine-nucleoside phosphorylase [Desulfurococcus sp.]|nr:purine-nucleoside phosphorylase [Desulfurococcus sp.]